MMSLSEWEAELKCSATGKPGGFCHADTTPEGAQGTTLTLVSFKRVRVRCF